MAVVSRLKWSACTTCGLTRFSNKAVGWTRSSKANSGNTKNSKSGSASQGNRDDTGPGGRILLTWRTGCWRVDNSIPYFTSIWLAFNTEFSLDVGKTIKLDTGDAAGANARSVICRLHPPLTKSK